MITNDSIITEEVRKGNFTNLGTLLNQENVFENFNTDAISAIINGCKINKDSQVLYLVFLEVSKIVNTPAEDYSLDELRNARFKLSEGETIKSLERQYHDKDYLEKWYKYQIQEKRYNILMLELFDAAYSIYEQTFDLYTTEIVEFICNNKNVNFRKYALLQMKEYMRFLADENQEIASMAQEITDFHDTYDALPSDGRLLIDLLETAFKNNFIKYNRGFEMNSYRIYGYFFVGYCELAIPEYYFKMPDHKMIAYKIYEAIVNKDIEFVSGKEPIFYTNLLSNNPKSL